MSKRCLYIASHYPISPNGVGGSQALYYEQLASLHELGLEVDLWHLTNRSTRQDFESFIAAEPVTWREVKRMCASVTLTTFPTTPSLSVRFRARLRDFVTGIRVDNPVYRTTALRQLKSLIRTHKPAFIWANHFAAAQVSALQRDVPFVYSHHDWLYRIKALRSASAESARKQLMEERVSRAAAAVVSGSATECEELRRIGCGNTHYIPVTYEPVPIEHGRCDGSEPRLIHLGGMSTTANRNGLIRFFEIVWPELLPLQPNMELVGEVDSSPPELSAYLSQVKCHGYVDDLKTVLRPYDIFVIPWEHNTGQRTKLPLAFNYSQAVVSARAAIACFPEAMDGDNCRLVEQLDEMAGVIEELLHDSRQREKLGRAARQTFETSFTRPALLSRYEQVVNSVCHHVDSRLNPHENKPVA